MYFMEDPMEHRTSAELEGFAEVIRPQKLSKKELLERWALALEKRKGTRPCTLRETEYKPVKERSGAAARELPTDCSLRGPGVALGWSDER
jgi:hypothetical protein